MKEIKSNPSKIVKVYIMNTKKVVNVVTDKGVKPIKLNEMSIMDRYSNGSYVVKDKVSDVYEVCDLKSKDDMEINEIEEETIKTEISKPENKTSLKEVDDRFMTIDDLLNNIEG